MNPRYVLVAGRAAHCCEYCHAPEAIFNVPFEVDHIKPTTKGGIDHEANWALACRACNLYKSNIENVIDPLTQQKTPLFKPRLQVWDEHFEVQEEKGFRIEGKTAVGRVTSKQLRMNSSLQLAARTQWAKLGLFP